MIRVDRDHGRFRAAHHNLPGPRRRDYVKNRTKSRVSQRAAACGRRYRNSAQEAQTTMQ